MKRIKTVALFLALTIVLGGCWGAVEINQLLIVMGMGVDKADHGGYRLTLEAARAHVLADNGAGYDNGNNKAYVNLHEVGNSVSEAMSQLTLMASRKLYTQQCELLVIGEELAKEDIIPVLEYILRSEEGRMTMPLVIARGTAAELYDETTYLEPMPAIHIAEIAEKQKRVSDLPITSIFDFLQALLDDTRECTAPLLETRMDQYGEPKAYFTGTAIFRDGQWIDEFTLSESRGLLTIRNGIQGGRITLSGLGGIIDLLVRNCETYIVPKYEKGLFSVEIYISESFTILNADTVHSVHEPENIRKIEELAREHELRQMTDAVTKAQILGTDVFGFGEVLRARYPKAFHAIQGQWPEFFRNLPVSYHIQVSVTSTGASLQPVTLRKEDRQQ